MAVITDHKVAVSFDNQEVSHYVASVISSTDYYAFGSPVPGRSFSIGSYRFGFQGMEKDNEISGFGSSYYTEFRQYDARIGRWFSTDPIIQPWMSPYCAMDNNPILFVDPFGLMAGDGDDKNKYYTEGNDASTAESASLSDAFIHQGNDGVEYLIREFQDGSGNVVLWTVDEVTTNSEGMRVAARRLDSGVGGHDGAGTPLGGLELVDKTVASINPGGNESISNSASGMWDGSGSSTRGAMAVNSKSYGSNSSIKEASTESNGMKIPPDNHPSYPSFVSLFFSSTSYAIFEAGGGRPTGHFQKYDLMSSKNKLPAALSILALGIDAVQVGVQTYNGDISYGRAAYKSMIILSGFAWSNPITASISFFGGYGEVLYDHHKSWSSFHRGYSDTPVMNRSNGWLFNYSNWFK